MIYHADRVGGQISMLEMFQLPLSVRNLQIKITCVQQNAPLQLRLARLSHTSDGSRVPTTTIPRLIKLGAVKLGFPKSLIDHIVQTAQPQRGILP